MAIKEKNVMLVKKQGGFLYVVKPYTSVHHVDGAVSSINNIKPVDGNISLNIITQADILQLFSQV